MQPILVSYEAPFFAICKKNIGLVGAMALTGPVLRITLFIKFSKFNPRLLGVMDLESEVLKNFSVG